VSGEEGVDLERSWWYGPEKGWWWVIGGHGDETDEMVVEDGLKTGRRGLVDFF
jgi:hypothetical protein